MEIQGITERLQLRAAEAAQEIYARFGQVEISWQRLDEASASYAAQFHDMGLRSGDRAVVMMKNSPASLALIFALLRSGIVWVPANTALVGEALAHVLRKVDARLIISDPDMVDILRASGALQEDRLWVVEDPDLPSGAPVPFTLAPPAPGALAAIMFTSGTTGPAKGVRVTHMMLEIAAKSVALCSDAREGDVFYLWEPFFHIGGAQVLLLPLFTRTELFIGGRFSASRFWDEVRAAKATHIHHLGGIIQMLLKQPASPLDREHGVRVAWGGGCAPEAWLPFEARFGVEIRECYGMTEASSLTTCNLEGVAGSIGRPMPWFDVVLKSPEGRLIGPGEGPGEIVVTTRLPGALFDGYYEDPAATARALRSDGFYTGDLGSIDTAGHFRFHGRTGDSIRCKGENVSSYEVESIADAHPLVEESVMIGLPAEVGENDIHLMVRRKQGATLSAPELAEWLGPRLARYQRPRFISFVETFPRTASQRVQKHLLKDHTPDWEQA